MSQEFLVGLVVSVVLGLIGYLLKRSIDNLDAKLDATCGAVEAMKLEMKGYEALTQYLKADVEAGKQEISTLRSAFYSIDRIIFAKGWETNHPVSPPRL